MAKKVLSIDIGLSSTKLCLLEQRGKNPKVFQYAKFSTPAHTIVDGEIRITEEFVSLLKRTIAEKKMKCKNVIFSIASSKIAMREVLTPKVSERKIATVVETNANDYFPIDLSQYQIGHIILGTSMENDLPKYRVMVLAVPDALINSYKELAKAIGMNLSALDYCGNSIFNAVKEECQSGTQMVIKVDEEASVVTIAKDGEIVLQRNVAYGINEALNTIMTQKIFGARDYEHALEKAMESQYVVLNANTNVIPAEEKSELDFAKEAVTSSLNRLINGIGRIMDYHTSRNTGALMDEIILTGVGARFLGLREVLEQELGVPTHTYKNTNILMPRTAVEEDINEYIECIGAILNPIGLTKDKKDRTEENANKESLTKGYVLLSLGVAVAATVLGVGAKSVSDAQKAYDKSVQELNVLSEIQSVYDRYSMQQASYEDIKKLYESTLDKNSGLLAFIDELEAKMPSDFNVLSLSSGMDSIYLNVEVTSKESMANALLQLRTFKSLSDISVSGAQDQLADDGTRTVSFSITGYYKTLEELRAEEALEETTNP